MRCPNPVMSFLAGAVIAGLAIPSPGAAQDGQAEANPVDVSSVDAVIQALYDVISGPAGERDWRRFESLFMPGARLIPTGVNPEGHRVSRVMTVADYVERNGPFFLRGPFFESEIGRTTERFGNIVHAFSSYESKRAPEQEPFSRGINSIQLFDDGERLWIATVLWDSERDGNGIPARYLGEIH